MFKLLTDQARKKVVNEYTLRRANVILSCFILVLVIGVVGLLPSYLLSNIKVDDARERMSIMEKSGLAENESNATEWIESMNQKLKFLSPNLDNDKPSEFIFKILEQRGVGISINNISWSRDKNRVTMVVDGIAKDRQTLIDFREKVSSSEYFKDVVLPISNLAQDRDIDFQIKLSPAVRIPEEKNNDTQ